MNRRGFLRGLACLPGLSFLKAKPEVVAPLGGIRSGSALALLDNHALHVREHMSFAASMEMEMFKLRVDMESFLRRDFERFTPPPERWDRTWDDTRKLWVLTLKEAA